MQLYDVHHNQNLMMKESSIAKGHGEVMEMMNNCRINEHLSSEHPVKHCCKKLLLLAHTTWCNYIC